MFDTPLIRHAWRSLLRTPAFTVTAAITLVTGLGAAVAIFAVVNAVLLRPLPYGQPERLVGAWHNLPPLNLNKVNQTVSFYASYKQLAKTIEGIGIYQDGQANVSEPGGVGEPQRLSATFVTHDLLPLFKVSPIRGRTFTMDEDRPNGARVVMISEGLWRSRFASDPRIIGRTLDIGGRTREIIGVMPSRFQFPSAATELWMPLQLNLNGLNGGFSYNGVARLKPGVTIDEAQRDFAAVLPRVAELYPNFAPGVSTQMVMAQAKPVPVITPLREDVVGDISGTLWMVAVAAGLVLLVACANVTNLILVRADGRQRELAVREALGAGRARVMLHFLAESAVLTGIAGAAALGVAWAAVRLLVASPVQIPRLAEVRIDAMTVAFAAGAALFVAAVCSVIPALRIGRARLSQALREGGRGASAGKAQQRVRGALVAAQIAVAIIVLSGSGLLLRSFQALNAVQPGFSADNVVTLWLSLPTARYANDSAVVRFTTELDRRVTDLPGVQHAGITSRLPLAQWGMNQNPFYPENDATYADKIPPLIMSTVTDGDYFEAMRIPLRAGRTFESLATQRGSEAVISQSVALQFWGDSTGHGVLGKRFRELPGGPLYTVVGVVGSVRDTSLAAGPMRVVYYPQAVDKDTLYSQAQRTFAVVVRSSSDPTAMISAVQRVVRELDPSLPTFRAQSMGAVMAASTHQLRFTMMMLGAAAGVTLLLGAVGLYGVLTYAVTLRTRELGVRIALGAQPSEVAGMMARQGVGLTVVGVLIGLGAFAFLARFLKSFLFGVTPADPLTLGVAALLMVVIAAVASWAPAYRASRVDPATTLRAE
jgi:putative ABC transport system permease protein